MCVCGGGVDLCACVHVGVYLLWFKSLVVFFMLSVPLIFFLVQPFQIELVWLNKHNEIDTLGFEKMDSP